MVSAGIQILGTCVGLLGWVGVIMACAIPMWKVSAFIGNNIVTAQIIWEGIWMNCVVQSTGQAQCKVYDSMLALERDLQAARALCVLAILVGIVGMALAIVGGKCTNCMDNEVSKARVCITAGAVFIIAGILCLIPMCWTASVIIQDFYNPMVPQTMKREMGTSLYIGWASSALLIAGGTLLCYSCPPKEPSYAAKYSVGRPNSTGQKV
ncbi:claudin-4-like [Paramormyrops kingsleyae]|uniref:claudin-4-like n=1 Tax=Paramormyrops kingsleyae TaxID=1676925 RepID=UPI000CD63351|nr:claudin-4-like [Paramormyrops kingsleyae]